MGMKTNDILTLTVSELAEALRNRQISAVEAADAYLSRIHEKQDEINAFISVDDGLVRLAAEEADRKLAGETNDLPLLTGVPAAVKDNMAVRGCRMTCASKMLEDFMPPYDATAVVRSGSVVLGKTNLDEFAMGSSCERSIIGATKNPLDTTRSAGGSSGGSAAAVAAYMAPWTLGTDTGGSCRQPAAFCGIVSMKPTYGLVSRYGVTELASSMDTVCPLTRNVYDNALILDCISGRDRRDMTSLDAPESFTANIGGGVRGMKIGLMRGMERLCEAGQVTAVVRAAGILEKLGAVVEVVDLPDPEPVIDTYFVLLAAECSSNFARYDGLKYGYSGSGSNYAEIMASSRSEGFGEEVKRRVLAGAYALSTTISGDRFRRVQVVRQTLCEQMDGILARYDAVLMPTAAGTAFGLAGFDDNPTALYNSDCFTALANLTGHPAITVPCGGDGVLPYGAMLMGARMCDAKVYKIAFALEAELGQILREEVRQIVL